MDLTHIIGPAKYRLSEPEITELAQKYTEKDYLEVIHLILEKENGNPVLQFELGELGDVVSHWGNKLKKAMTAPGVIKKYLNCVDQVNASVEVNEDLPPEVCDYFRGGEDYKKLIISQQKTNKYMQKYNDVLEKYNEGYRYSFNLMDRQVHELQQRYYKDTQSLARDLLQTYAPGVKIN